MSANKYKPHVLILPEDDANRQIINGFLTDPAISRRAVQPLENAGGWTQVIANFLHNHVAIMQNNLNRYMILVFDSDNAEDRIAKVRAGIPADVKDRVFILTTLSKPEDLKRAGLGTFEEIGMRLATDCRNSTRTTWDHSLLKHNADELDRMGSTIRLILFPQ